MSTETSGSREQSRAEQVRTEQSRAGQNRVEQRHEHGIELR